MKSLPEIERLINRLNLDSNNTFEQNLLSIIQHYEPNLILLSDAYKYSHYRLYNNKLTKMTSYLESRGGMFKKTVFFGLQYILKKYLVGQVLSEYMIKEAEKILRRSLFRYGCQGQFEDCYFEASFEESEKYSKILNPAFNWVKEKYEWLRDS